MLVSRLFYAPAAAPGLAATAAGSPDGGSSAAGGPAAPAPALRRPRAAGAWAAAQRWRRRPHGGSSRGGGLPPVVAVSAPRAPAQHAAAAAAAAARQGLPAGGEASAVPVTVVGVGSRGASALAKLVQHGKVSLLSVFSEFFLEKKGFTVSRAQVKRAVQCSAGVVVWVSARGGGQGVHARSALRCAVRCWCWAGEGRGGGPWRALSLTPRRTPRPGCCWAAPGLPPSRACQTLFYYFLFISPRGHLGALPGPCALPLASPRRGGA